MLGVIMAVVDSSIVNVAITNMAWTLGASIDEVGWVVTGYILASVIVMPLNGWLTNRFGRRNFYAACVILFTVASFLCGTATTVWQLVAYRVLQGIGGGALQPTAQAIIFETYPPDKRSGAMAIFGLGVMVGPAIGPTIGGILVDNFSWPLIFFINLPIGIAAFVLAARYIANTRAEKRPETVDVLGATTVTAGLLVLVYDIVKAQEYGWTSGRTLGLFALAVALLGAFVVTELRSKAPLIRLGIFRVRSLTSANVAMLFVMSGLFGMFYFASIYVQEILGYSPLKAGVAFLPVTVGIVIGAGLAQPAISALGVRVVPTAGIALAALGLILLSSIPVHGSYLTDLFPGLMVMSIGMGLTFVPVTLIATTNIDAADSGLASGLFNTSQQVGGALGLAVLSSVAASKTSAVHGVTHAAALVDGFQLAFLVGAGLMLGAIAVILVLIRRRHVESIGAQEAVPVAA
jgi:EmrB/QacA subfamily drug resistance transporter